MAKEAKSEKKSPPKSKKPKVLADLKPGKRTTQSKALAALKWKLKPIRTRGVCAKLGCNIKFPNARRVFCKKHKKALRKVQLKLNNVVWNKRVKAGTAGHHVVYKGGATEFAVKKTAEAEKKIKAGKATIDLPTFKKILKEAPKTGTGQAKKALAKPEKKAKGLTKKEAKPLVEKSLKAIKKLKPKAKKEPKHPKLEVVLTAPRDTPDPDPVESEIEQ